MTRTIDINCDLGEGFGNWRMGDDDALLPLITTANVACGFHGGDPLTMLRTVERALELGVVVGAHPGLPDLLGFGRRVMAISPEDAYAYVLYQAGALAAMLGSFGSQLHHVKPHGALYTMLNERADLAVAVADAIAAVMAEPALYWPSGAEDAALVQEAYRRDYRVVLEFYPDLRYTAERRIVVERRKAVVPAELAAARLERFLSSGVVETVDGGTVALEAESICVHGDGPTAVEIVTAVRAQLDLAGCRVAAAGARLLEEGAR
ncbi:MAG: 5-oxoprolinase subunit PxpA [Gaiellales bacterium]